MQQAAVAVQGHDAGRPRSSLSVRVGSVLSRQREQISDKKKSMLKKLREDNMLLEGELLTASNDLRRVYESELEKAA